MNPISFPGLGLEFHISRVAFSLFGKDIYWYGIIIALGFLLGATYCYRTCRRYGIRPDDVIDLLLFAVPGGIIGARIYYVLFYLDLFRDDAGKFQWGKAVAIWDGGLAIYGGVIAAILILAAVCRAKKLNFFAFADLGSFGLFLGQAMGRWGNFVNQECFGGETSLPWRMGLTVGGRYLEVHPTFLYESLWNVAGFLFCHFLLRKKRKFDGEIFWFYLMWYGLGRFWIEGMRTDSLYIGHTPIRVSQVVALVSVVIGAAMLIWNLAVKKADGTHLFVNRVAAGRMERADVSAQAQDAPEDVPAHEEKAQAPEDNEEKESAKEDADHGSDS